jgi:hypothetical protein
VGYSAGLDAVVAKKKKKRSLYPAENPTLVVQQPIQYTD